MKVSLNKYKPASQKAISQLEEWLGTALPTSYKQFVQEFDGATPEDNQVKFGKRASMGIRTFIKVSKIKNETKYLESDNSRLIPIAEDGCGNYVVMDLADRGKVYFWDHEIEGGLYLIAANFFRFLSKIEPFDINSIILNASLAGKVWIDPEFKKQMIEQGLMEDK